MEALGLRVPILSPELAVGRGAADGLLERLPPQQLQRLHAVPGDESAFTHKTTRKGKFLERFGTRVCS